MRDLRSKRFEKLVLGLIGLILGLIQGSRPGYGLGRLSLRSRGPDFGFEQVAQRQYMVSDLARYRFPCFE